MISYSVSIILSQGNGIALALLILMFNTPARKNFGIIFAGIMILLLAILTGSLLDQGAASPQDEAARIASVSGSGFAHDPGQEDWVPLAKNLVVASGGQVFAGTESLIRVDLPDGSQVYLGANTLVTVFILSTEDARLVLNEGKIWIIPGTGPVQLDLPFAIGFAEGAYIGASYSPIENVGMFTCLQGVCQVGNEGGSLTLESNQSSWFSADTKIPPLLKEITLAQYDEWARIYPQAVDLVDQPAATSESFSMLAGTATQFALTQSAALTATATALRDVTPGPTSTLNTPVPTVSYTTSFTNPAGPTSGTISNCVHSYYVDAVDPEGVNYVKVEHSFSPNFSNSSSVKLTNVWGNTYAEPRVYDTTANPGTDTVYWRFWALDNSGNISYYPAGAPFSYKDPLNCGGPVKFSNVVGPTSGEIIQCLNFYSVRAIDNTERIFSLKVEYALNPKLNNSQWLDMAVINSTWSGTHLIKTQNNPGPDTVYWRFWARTYNHGNDTYYSPASGTYSFLDNLNCGGPTPTMLPTLFPTATNLPSTSTATLTPIPSATSTRAPSPTATRAPSATPTLTPSATATQTQAPSATSTLTATATPLP